MGAFLFSVFRDAFRSFFMLLVPSIASWVVGGITSRVKAYLEKRKAKKAPDQNET